MIRHPSLSTAAAQEWDIPQALFDALNQDFGFATDLCATFKTAKCPTFYPAATSLSETWSGVCWLKPPFGRELIRWLCKASESAADGATVVCVVPAWTDAEWWHEYAMQAAEIRFVRGRPQVAMKGGLSPVPVPLAVVVFASDPPVAPVISSLYFAAVGDLSYVAVRRPNE
jgi:phage N-6-adenine-methyltransferase